MIFSNTGLSNETIYVWIQRNIINSPVTFRNMTFIYIYYLYIYISIYLYIPLHNIWLYLQLYPHQYPNFGLKLILEYIYILLYYPCFLNVAMETTIVDR